MKVLAGHRAGLKTVILPKRNERDLDELPEDVREFILRPINRSYLDLAIRLSGLSVERLRGIAEGILDITY